MVLVGTQMVRDTGDLARFGAIVFQILAPLQLALAAFFSAMLAASAVAQEKDRRTLVLLLLTNLTNAELVLGKLAAALLGVVVMLAAALPVFFMLTLLGGVSPAQIARVFAVTLVSVLACGSLGSTLALWREKTFQALAMTVLMLVSWLAVWEIVGSGLLGESWLDVSCRSWAAGFSPWRAVVEATRPTAYVEEALGPLGTPVNLFLLAGTSISVLLCGVAVAMVRYWNSTREARPVQPEEGTPRGESIWGAEHDTKQETNGDAAPADAVPAAAAAIRSRRVWDNPIMWREIRTWAYGRKILVIRLAYLMLFGLAAVMLHGMIAGTGPITTAGGAAVLVPLLLLSLVLVNAQAVTALTSERDGRALDLLLVTDLTAKEIVFGKLGGILYNTKEMVALPLLLCGYLWFADCLSAENLVYLLLGLAVLYCFSATLGVHAGMTYVNSQAAVATSLGTLFFLSVGVLSCMYIMVAFSTSFHAQFSPFVVFMLGGGVGLYTALGARNPSVAIGLASFLCPVLTFVAVTSFLLGQTLGVLIWTIGAYGFATAAMLIPAIYEFDVATGRKTAEEP